MQPVPPGGQICNSHLLAVFLPALAFLAVTIFSYSVIKLSHLPSFASLFNVKNLNLE